MARAKKETALTPEERLQAALVPDWEWPYKLPENWCWVSWGSCGDFIAGNGFKNEFQGFTVHSIPFYKVGSLKLADTFGYLFDKSNTINEDIRQQLKATIIPQHSILFAKIGEAIRLNRRAINEVPCCIDNNMMAFVPKVCLFRYAFYWSQGIDLYDYTNATTVPAIRKTDLEGIPFPLPSLAEQQRIVDRIESLFAKLDEAKEKAQAVVDSFETRKAAILHKAFTGKLTANWREEHGVGMESWEMKRLNQLVKPRAGYAFDSKKFTDSGYQIIRMGNLYGGELDLKRNPVFIAEDDVDEIALKRSLINDGDILITLTGTKYKRDYGYAVCVTNPNNLLVNQRILCLTPSMQVERNYVLYYLRSNIFRDVFFSNETGGVNQGNVSSKFVENIEIYTPSLDEQHIIVSVLNRMMEKEQQAKEAAETVLDQIALMKKSILARAFRGELGTNDPTDEPAIEILKRTIQQERK